MLGWLISCQITCLAFDFIWLFSAIFSILSKITFGSAQISVIPWRFNSVVDYWDLATICLKRSLSFGSFVCAEPIVVNCLVFQWRTILNYFKIIHFRYMGYYQWLLIFFWPEQFSPGKLSRIKNRITSFLAPRNDAIFVFASPHYFYNINKWIFKFCCPRICWCTKKNRKGSI